MRALVVGLGSMGKRRIRCLRTLGIEDIQGVDQREDRRIEVEQSYGLPTHADLADAWPHRPDVVIISVPPKAHVAVMKSCIDRAIPFFVEASVVDDGLAEVMGSAQRLGLVAAPSSTLRFHPALQNIFAIVRSGRLGKVSNIMLHSGQYLPDWHPYESVADFYVSDPQTGGAREIVPFEMTWFTELFGFPRRVCGQYRKTVDIPGASQIDDTYNALLDYGSFLATITVDVVSRHATRRLIITGELATLAWSWDDPVIHILGGNADNSEQVPYETQQAAHGYNKNIGEAMYVDEVRAFLDAVAKRCAFPNTLARDHRVLQLLYAIERSDLTGQFQEFHT